MRYGQVFQFAVVFALVTSGIGCSSVRWQTSTETELTGLFQNNWTNMTNAYARVVEHQTTREELEALGFTINAPNVDRFEGFSAINVILPASRFEGADQNQLKKFISEDGKYMVLQFPYKSVRTKSHRLYFSKKDREIRGREAIIRFILDDNLVVKKELNDVNRDKDSRSHTFARGAIEIINELSSAVGGPLKVIK